MAEVEPLILVTGSPNTVQERGASDTIPAAALPDATTSVKGALSATDKTKLDTVESNAAAPPYETADISDGAITTAKLGADAVDDTKLADDAVGAEHIQADAVGSSELADDAVDTAAIQDDAVTTAKIASSAVTTAKINADAVTAAKSSSDFISSESASSPPGKSLIKGRSGTKWELKSLHGGNVTGSCTVTDDGDTLIVDVTDGGIDTDELAANAVTNTKLADMAPSTFKGRRASETATGNPQDMTAPQARRILQVRESAGGAAFFVPKFRPQTRLPELHRVGQWIAGDVDDTNLTTSHGTGNDLFPFMCFSAINFYGYPHKDHDRLASGVGGVNTSGFNGYEEGLLLVAGTLDEGDALRFSAEGFMENTAEADAFVEFVLEPNPTAGTTAGANRMRMLSGELGATWTGTKAFRWECLFSMGYANTGDEYAYTWHMQIEDVLETGGSERVTSGHDFKGTDTYLGARFRVDEITNLDTYDATYQALSTLRLEIQKYDVGAA